MQELKKTTHLVKHLLENDERCRNSDSFLYLNVLRYVAEQKGFDLKNITIPQFLLEMHGTEFPIFESVRRARQKLQEHHPELCACEAVEQFRAESELEYRAFARSEV